MTGIVIRQVTDEEYNETKAQLDAMDNASLIAFGNKFPRFKYVENGKLIIIGVSSGGRVRSIETPYNDVDLNSSEGKQLLMNGILSATVKLSALINNASQEVISKIEEAIDETLKQKGEK